MTIGKPTLKSKVKTAHGELSFHQAPSSACGCDMAFSVFTPPAAAQGPVPVLYWLSGLTCTEENFMIKAGAQRYASEHGLMLVAPDTSPRGLNLPGEDDHWDFGSGAGFYLNATQKPWAPHYRMYDYVVNELPEIINAHFPADPQRTAISGHSMGGHGALTIGQKNPDRYKSVSAFSPICAPMQCPWGQKAFSNYLGDDQNLWRQYDATEILSDLDQALPMLIDIGDADNFLAEQLKPELLKTVCEQKGHALTLRMQPGYDHSYYFISTFIGDHVKWHAEALKA